MRAKLEDLFAQKENKIIEILEIFNKNKKKIAYIIDDTITLLDIISDGDIKRAILKNIPLNRTI